MKYKVGDKIRIKSIDWYNEHKDMNGNVRFGWEEIFNPCTARHCGQVLTITHINSLGWYEVEEEAVFVHDEMIEGLVVEDTITLNGKEVLLKLANIELPSGTTKIWECPKGYQFVDENGNVINATKIVLEKRIEYPKTYEECRKVLDIDRGFLLNMYSLDLWKGRLLEVLQILLICRNAYWKIAGEEMGLGKPWEPDWTNEEWPDMAYISYDGKSIDKENGFPCCNMILIFPTEEMRDYFYQHFKEEIETCKELL